MSFAGHLPTMRFDLAEWQAMRVFEQTEPWEFPGEGYYRASVNGKPIVGYCAPLDSEQVSFAVRPVVRVKAGRRVDPVRCSLCGSCGMERYCGRSHCPGRLS